MAKGWRIEKERGQLALLTANAICWTQRIISLFSSIFVIKIIWSFVEGQSFAPENSMALVQVVVVIYFLSWSLAALKGIKTQAVVLNSPGGVSIKMPLPGIFALVIGIPIGAIAMALVLFGESFKKTIFPFWDRSINELLVVVLSAFWLWDIAWHFLVRKSIRLMVDSSKANFQGRNKRYLEIERIELLETFIFGKWRIYRISFGVLTLALLFLLMVFIEEYVHIPVLNVSIHLDAAIAIVIFSFVLFSEGWIWIKRIRIFSIIDALIDLGDRYYLAAKPSDVKNNEAFHS